MLLRSLSSLLALLCMAPALLAADTDQPIHISADTVVIDEKNNLSRYQGHVELRQGGVLIQADTILFIRRGDELQQIEATGRPVRFSQQAEQAEQTIRGEALNMQYQADTGVVELSGQAKLWQGPNQFSGETIRYDADSRQVKAERGEEGPVTAVIHPKKPAEEVAPKDAPEATP